MVSSSRGTASSSTCSFRLEAGDRISFVAGLHDAQAFFKQLHLGAAPIRQVMLVGGGRIAYYLARQLIDAGLSVKILESDLARLASDDVLGRKLEDARLTKTRRRAPKRKSKP